MLKFVAKPNILLLIINLTILECKYNARRDGGIKMRNNKSNHIGM